MEISKKSQFFLIILAEISIIQFLWPRPKTNYLYLKIFVHDFIFGVKFLAEKWKILKFSDESTFCVIEKNN